MNLFLLALLGFAGYKFFHHSDGLSAYTQMIGGVRRFTPETQTKIMVALGKLTLVPAANSSALVQGAAFFNVVTLPTGVSAMAAAQQAHNGGLIVLASNALPAAIDGLPGVEVSQLFLVFVNASQKALMQSTLVGPTGQFAILLDA